MIINLKELEKSRQNNYQFNYSYSDLNVEDALLKQINDVNSEIDITVMENNEIYINVTGAAFVDYLDARTLDEIKLIIDFNENLVFTFDFDEAKKLDIEYVEEELDVKELIWELILINVPFNYSESKKVTTSNEQDFNMTSPFSNIFK